MYRENNKNCRKIEEKKYIPRHCGNPKKFLAHVLHLTPSKPGLQEHFPASSHLPSNDPFPSQLHSIKDIR